MSLTTVAVIGKQLNIYHKQDMTDHGQEIPYLMDREPHKWQKSRPQMFRPAVQASSAVFCHFSGVTEYIRRRERIRSKKNNYQIM